MDERAASIMEENELMWVDPKLIKYSQACISREFRNNNKRWASENNKSASYAEAVSANRPLALETNLEHLKSGKLKVTDFPPIRVVPHENILYTLDNRRLWVFRSYGALIPVLQLKEAGKEFFQKLSREGDGETVTFITPDDAEDYKMKQTLLSVVLKWSLEDILNDKLLVNKVQPIPIRFNSLSKYLECFKDPLVEETRAILQRSLEEIQSASYIPLERVEERESKSKSDSYTQNLKTFMLILDPDKPIVNRGKKGKLAWKPKPTDMILLTNEVPQSEYQELQRSGVLYTLGILKGSRENDDHVLSATVYAPSESPECKALRGGEEFFGVQMGNLATIKRIWEALVRALPEENHHMCQHLPILNSLLYSEMGGDLRVLESSKNPPNKSIEEKELIDDYCVYRGLNESQSTVLKTTVTGLLLGLKPHIRLIQGPPGTGKTATLATLLSILSCLNQRTLVCAPTNVAISEVLLRFLGFFTANPPAASNNCLLFGQFCALYRPAKGEDCVQLGDLVLIGNDDRLDLDGPLEQVILDWRVDRLMDAFSPVCGWRASTSSLLEFLRSSTMQYETYKETQTNEVGGLSFIKFLKKKLKLLAEKFLNNCHVLGKDLPSRFTSASCVSVLEKCSMLVTRFFDQVMQSESKVADDMLRCFRESSGVQVNEATNNKNASGFAKRMHELQDALAAMLDDLTFPEVLNQPKKEWVHELCLAHAKLVFSTVSSAGRHILLKSKPFQCVIVDEASQCVEAETVIVTSMKGVKQMVLVGDQMQLPATVMSQVAQGCGYGRSLFERLHVLGHPVNLLDVQYRMHPEISLFPNAQFYGGKIQDGDNVWKGRYNTEASQQIFSGPYKFINIREGREQRDEGQTKSWTNVLEVEIVVLLISRIRKACEKAKVEKLSIGVISPYQSQVDNLERRLSHYIKMDDITVEVKSVDGFQGREKDIIVFSTVRANSDGNIGFLDDHRRLNVAITRAKYCMWIVGNEKTLTSQDAVWKALFEDAKQRRCIVDPGSDSEMTKIIRKVTQELNQLADLLHPNSVLFNGTLWKVLFAREMKTTITSIKSRETRQHLLNKMLHLANGRRSPYLKPTDLASARYKKLIQVEPVIDYFLVWTVDVENGTQIIKVWNAVRISELSSLVRRLEGGFSMCTDDYIDRCTRKQVDKFKKSFVVPAKWSSAHTIAKYKSLEETKHKPVSGVEGVVDNTELPLEKSDVDDSVLLMKFYSLSSGIAHQLLTALDGSQLSLPFEVNEQEAAIIQYPRSSFIIGRSGTGKTTVITTKLLQREQEFWIASNGIASAGDEGKEEEAASFNPEATGFLKQALVTLSPKLCAAVKHNISKTRRSMQQAVGAAANAGNNSDDVFEEIMLDDEAEAKLMGAIPDNFVHIPRDCYPLVITFRKLLTMLDGSISRSFFSLNVENQQEDAVIVRINTDLDTVKVEKQTAEVRVGENGEVVEVGGDQGDLDSGKEDEDFSDVDEEGNLSEGDDDDDEDESLQDGKGKEVSKRGQWEGTEVEFERFAWTYWLHFDVKLTKNLDPSMVYTEIMSHIKGSVESLRSPHGRLTREVYVAMAERRSSLYTEQQRDNIYSLFLKYEKQKRENCEYDIADLVTHLYLELQKSGGFLGEKMHFLYVDEVQDFTQAQIALFKFICSNLEQGFVFAGDTAQTIARGVGFRFEDARRLYYEEFLGNTEQFAVPQKASLEKKVPDLFQLTMNFRTHMGVVAIADSVVKLLHRFFPNSLDKLDPERSVLHGDVPVFLKTVENRGLVTSLFDAGGTAGGGGCEFGAEQVILVRNSESKDQILTQIGHKGLVLSVHECKGLEFQDVLLYNFFADSPLRNKWRVIIAYMVEQDLVTNVTFPQFDVKHHNLLCSELKQLYVMLTRARQRLWIYDECFENHQPMLDYWEASGLVKVRQLDASLAEELQGKSSADDWNNRGVKMFNEHHYDAAKLCFDRAGDARRAQHALAASLQQKAEKFQVTNPKESIRFLREAAELYISIGKGENAAKCYQKIGEYKKAGFVYREVCKPPNLEAAGDCFAEIKCWEEAAIAYSGINMVKCLTMCWRGKLLDQGLGFIKEWEERRKRKSETHNSSISVARDKKEKLELEAAKTEFLKRAAAHHHLGRNVGEMMKFVLLFPSLAVRRSFLKRRDYMDQLQFIEEGAGNFEKAAELAEVSGNLKYAATLFEKAGSISLAVEKLLHFATMEILWKDGNKGWPKLLTPEVIQVLEHAISLVVQHRSNVDAAIIHELHIFKSVSSAKIEIYEKSYEQSRKSKVIRLQLLSSYLLLQELARIVRCAIEQECVENTVISGLLRDQVPNLMKVWDDWSKCIVSFIFALDRLKKGRGREEDEPMLECIYSYLGVTRQQHTVTVKYSKAHWLADSSLSALRKEKSNQALSVGEFAHLASQFFDTQLLEVGDLLETVLSDLKKVASGIVDMKVRFSNLVRVLLLRFNVLWLLNAKTSNGNTRVQLKTKIIEVATQLYDLLFIDMPAYSMKEVAVIRESPDAQLVFETLAKDLSQTEVETTSLFRIMSYDQLGKLVTLQPFLGNDWALGEAFNNIERILRRLTPPQRSFWPDFHPKVALWQGSQSQHSAVLKSIPMPKYQCSHWSMRIQWFMTSLRDIYTIEDYCAPGYLSPMVFLGLFERGVIATCAYCTHLKSMLVTESMALCYMGGKHYEPYYSMLLNSECVGGHQILQDLLKDAAHLILELLFQVLGLEKWFDISKIDKGMYLPLVVLRLFKLVITICINTDQGQIHKSVLRGLTMLFQEQSPVLAELPPHFKDELQKLFLITSTQNLPITKLLTAFSLAMKAMGDPLIVLRRNGRQHAGMSWHTTAQKNLRVVWVEVQLQTHSTFNLAALEQKKITVGANETASKTDMEKMGSENEKELKMDDEDEEIFDCDKVIEDTEGAQDISHLISEDSLPSDSSSSFSKPGQKVSKVAPSSMTSDSVILEDGTRLSRAFVEQLKRLLAAARARIEIPLTPVESYQREARSIFLRKCIMDKVYIELFNSKACSLLADVDEHLMKLNEALDVIKDYERLDDEGELLEKFSDAKDSLEGVVEELNSKCERHEEMDQFWLHEKIKSVEKLLENSQAELQGPLKKLFKAAGVAMDSQEPPQSGPTPKSGQAQNLPQPNNKANKNKNKNKNKKKKKKKK